MKTTKCSPSPKSFTNRPVRRITTGFAMALALAIPQQSAEAATLTVNLGAAADFAVLGGSGISIAAPIDSTVVTGDIGSFPTASITGLENLVLNGTNQAGNAITQQAKNELGVAYGDAEGRATDVFFPLIHDVGGLTLESGVYSAPSSLAVTGTLTLDGEGDPNAVWIFQIASTFNIAGASSIDLINGAQAGNVFWQVGTSATLSLDSHLEGTIMAQQSITANAGATMNGRLLALDGFVSLDNNVLTVPEPGSSLLVALGLSLAALTRRRKN